MDERLGSKGSQILAWKPGFIGYFQELINWKKIDLINSSTGVLIFETEKQFENLDRSEREERNIAVGRCKRSKMMMTREIRRYRDH